MCETSNYRRHKGEYSDVCVCGRVWLDGTLLKDNLVLVYIELDSSFAQSLLFSATTVQRGQWGQWLVMVSFKRF